MKTRTSVGKLVCNITLLSVLVCSVASQTSSSSAPLNSHWNLISRTILPVIHQYNVANVGSQSGLGYAPVAGPSLLWVSNTDRDLCARKVTGAFCFLTTSRLYRHSSLRSRAPSSSSHVYHATQTILHPEVSQRYSFTLQLFAKPDTGTFGRGAVLYGPSGGAGGFAAYDPRTGTYARGGAVDGPYDSHDETLRITSVNGT